ncbi:MAG: hypothetical protein ACXV2F_06990 [Halobacteriota archaeon]
MSGVLGPRVRKGALVGIDIFNPAASIIIFQYNPATLTRTLKPRLAQRGEQAKHEALRLAGAPTEDIALDIEIVDGDQPTVPGVKADMGVYPQLSALEMLLYPKSYTVLKNTALLTMTATKEVISPLAPLILLVWGKQRVLPVRVDKMIITEEIFDALLNPIRAKVSLELQVLSYSDLPASHPGSKLFMTHQVIKERAATLGSIANVGSNIGTILKDAADLVEDYV